MTKRVMDLSTATFALSCLAPLMAAIALAIRIDSGGAVFFGHERVGREGKRFRVWKFRTMRERPNASSGPEVTAAGDPRVTRVGRVLRATKLDELPQFWNVLVGEMSIVGPRPEVPKYVERFARDYSRILSVRPGLTDEASIVYRNEEDVLARSDDPEALYVEEVLPAKIRHYVEYIENASLRRDLSIIARTAWKVARP